MEIETAHGLTTGLLDAGEALEADWASLRDRVDLVTVVDPVAECWQSLRRAGFAIKPAWVTWISPVDESDEAFLDRLSVSERRNVRAALRAVAGHGYEMKVTHPLDAPSFDAFLDVYERQISTMRYGIPFARLQREEILEQGADYFLVQVFEGSTLVGCCVCWKRDDVSTVQIRFGTTAPDSRRNRLVRAMYLRVFQAARELGFRNISLGTDPALYGHIAKPGLFGFKSRLGFTPIPARLFGSADDPDEASRVLRLGTLSEPSVLLSYQLPDGGAEAITAETALRLDVLTGDPDTDLNPYRADFLADIGIRQIR
ncbi:GNAT family N-acetyltransferase [Amycolatopsis nigrescens]|uniref:GNAT family N-acetyltransferase n=1 Tax=Amycolatopsis nigrescens TaxID=381445 RepID=UPI00035DD8D6|nr:GNAT family N-acetyltransferase [Amycolatopsis nigrescens]